MGILRIEGGDTLIFFGIAWIVGLFFAINIGASGTAASMGAAYGGGAIKKRWVALVLVAISVFLGAAIGGGNVVKTISAGIIPSHLINVNTTIIILVGACMTLFLANMLRVPLSTSEVTVGSLVGVGMAYQSLYFNNIIFLMVIWLVLPFLSYIIAFVLGKFTPFIERKLTSFPKQKSVKMILIILLIGAGCYEAFSAGMNNVANAMGPLIGAGLINLNNGLIWGALFVALGAITLGGRVLDTNAKKITDLTLLQGSAVSFTSGTLVIIASVFGLPVPLTQATTMAILGVGSAENGFALFKKGIVKQVFSIWLTSPVSSLVISYLLVNIFIKTNIYSVVIVLGAFIMSFGYFVFFRSKPKQNNSLLKSNQEIPLNQLID